MQVPDSTIIVGRKPPHFAVRRGDVPAETLDDSFAPQAAWYLPLKAVAEWTVALLLFILALPVICLAALLVKLTSPGPMFYKQTRLGKKGRPFTLVKIRTMVDDAELQTGAVWASSNDPRVTTVGRFLRNTHIDEFPQLLNVLSGRMGLIGPRPERPEFTRRLELEVPQYKHRVSIRPGVTGLAQLQLPADTSIEDVRRKLDFDLYYICNVNPWLDLRIALFTCLHLISSIACCAWMHVALPDAESIAESATEFSECRDPESVL